MSIQPIFKIPRAALARNAASLYRQIVAAARQPDHYGSDKVADTLDGRFDMITLFMFLTLHRLKNLPPEDISNRAVVQRFSQFLFDTMFHDMDRSLREMGVGDLGVARRIKTMAEAFYGRAAAYEAALTVPTASGRRTALAAALRRNLYRDEPGIDDETTMTMAGLVLDRNAALTKTPLIDLLSASFDMSDHSSAFDQSSR